MRLLRAVLGVLGAVAVVMAAAGPASAHDVLISTTPSANQRVAVTPSSIVLTLDQPALALGTAIVVEGPSGPAQQGKPALVNATVRQDLVAGAPAGRYVVRWRVTSSDGHPVSGQFSFTSVAAAAAVATPTSTTTGTSAATTPIPSGTSAATTEAADAQSGWGALPAVGLVVVLLLVALIVGLVVRRRRGRPA